MYPILFHLYGPFSIHTYGVAIAIGFLCALFIARKDPRKKNIITDDQAVALLCVSIIVGIFGARLFYFLIECSTINWYDFFAFWQGGGSELGSILAIIIFASGYLYIYKIPILPLLDIASTYAPLAQGFSRIGCFFAGCCHGLPTHSTCAIIYTDPNSLAPLNVPFFPIQLVMSISYFMLFFILFFIKAYFPKAGQLFTLYIMGASAIRFFVDFYRGDVISKNTFSAYQLIAIALFFIALFGFLIIFKSSSRSQKNEHF